MTQRITRMAVVAALWIAPELTAQRACEPGRTALVLSGGGVKGLAHIGVLAAFDSLGVRPDLIVGTSMGAIVGAMYASGYAARQIDSLARALPIADVARPFRVPAPHPWDHRVPLLFLVRGRTGFELQTGIVDEALPNARLNEALLAGNLIARGRFDRLPIPFIAVATDLRDRRTVPIASGDLARAVRASSAIPLVLPPVVLDGAVLVDGGLSANIPIAEARAAGATRVIVVDVTEHPKDTLDSESALALADQTLGFLFHQPMAEFRPGDVLIRPAVDRYRSLDFSDETVDAVVRLGREAADSVIGRVPCLPNGPPVAGALPRTLTRWSVRGRQARDGRVIGRLLDLEEGPLDVAVLRQRLVALGQVESFRGVWLNPTGVDDSVELALDPIRAPTTVGGGGLAYDHEIGGRAWAGLFSRRLAGTALEGSALLSLGRLQQDIYGSLLWHADLRAAPFTPVLAVRLRTEDVRQFKDDGAELGAIQTSDARATLGVELRPKEAWRVRLSGDAFAYGGDEIRGYEALGGSLRVERFGSHGLELVADAVATRRFGWATAAVTWPARAGRLSVRPSIRVGATDDVPLQWMLPLGGDEGFPGLHLGERRGSGEVFGSVRFGYAIKGPVELRLLAAAGRASGTGPTPEWDLGARLGLGADTPAGPIDAGYGVTTDGRRALYIRLGKWF